MSTAPRHNGPIRTAGGDAVGRPRRPSRPTPAHVRRVTGGSTESFLRFGEVAERRGDYVAAMTAYTTAATDDDVRVSAEAHFRLGRVAWRQGRLDDAMTLYERTRAKAREVGDDEIRANAENGIGTVHCERRSYAQARASYQVAFEMTKDPSLRGRIHLNLGAIASMEGDHEQARELYQLSADEFKHAGDENGLGLALYNIGLLHAGRSEWNEADEAFGQCLDLCERLDNQQMLANVLLKRAELDCLRQRLDCAAAACEQAHAIFARLGDEGGRAEALCWQARAWRLLGKLEEAEARLHDVVRAAVRLQMQLLEARATQELGLVKLALGDPSLAERWLRKAQLRYSAAGERRVAEEIGARLEEMGVR